MSESIRYLIASNIVTTGTGITISNGYNYTFPSGNCFLAAEITEIPDPSKPAFIVDILDSSPIEDQAHTVVWDYTYLVRVYNVHSTSNANVNYDNRNIQADVIKALKVDVTRGGYAHFTEFGNCGPALDMDNGAPYEYLTVICRTTVNGSNPYSL